LCALSAELAQPVVELNQDRRRYDEALTRIFEQGATADVMSVTAVERSEERSGIEY
jgi:hypothetical protein